MDKNRYPSVQQELERLFPSTRGGGRAGGGEGESRELQRVGAGESSASTTTDTILVLHHHLPQNGQLQKYVDKKLVETKEIICLIVLQETA